MIYDLFALVVNWLLILLCRVEQANNKSLAELSIKFFSSTLPKIFPGYKKLYIFDGEKLVKITIKDERY